MNFLQDISSKYLMLKGFGSQKRFTAIKHMFSHFHNYVLCMVYLAKFRSMDHKFVYMTFTCLCCE